MKCSNLEVYTCLAYRKKSSFQKLKTSILLSQSYINAFITYQSY